MAINNTGFNILTGEEHGFFMQGGLQCGDTIVFRDWINGGRTAYAADYSWFASYGDVSSNIQVSAARSR